MARPSPPDHAVPPEPPPNDRLDSWKEIAAYLRRDESTVRRWGKNGLPVHRHQHSSRATVYAYKCELDAWWKQTSAAEGNQAEPAQPLAGSVAPPARNWLWYAIAAAAVAVLVFSTARLFLVTDRTRSAGAPVPLVAFMNLGGEVASPTFSPDGKQVAFSWATGREPGAKIYVKLVGSESALQLTRAKGVEDFSPAWSPDGREIAFLRQSSAEAGIFRVSALGGPERKVASLRPDRYYTVDWAPDGEHIAVSRRASADDPYCVVLFPKDGGDERQLSFPRAHTEGDLRFAFSPDGKYVALLRHTDSLANPAAIEVMTAAGGEPSIIYGQREWIGNLAWSADSRSLVITGDRQGIRELWRVFLDGRPVESLAQFGENAFFPAVSKQGARIAFVREVEDSDLWSTALATPRGPAALPEHVLSSTRVEGAPRFSPDGKKIAFQSVRSGTIELWVSDPDGNNAVQLTHLLTSKPEMPTWSPDGLTIAFGAAGAAQLISASGGDPWRVAPDFEGYELPVWSRDGRSIYYSRMGPKAQTQIWKVTIANGSTFQVTKNGGFSSMESPDAKFLYFTKRTIPGIWKMPVSGGEETLVLKDFDPALGGYWAAFDDGIYYVNGAAKPRPAIEFYNFATQQAVRIAEMTGSPNAWFGGLTVSPDRRSIVFSQRQYLSSEIILGEGFR